MLTKRPMAVAIVYGLIVEIGIGSIPTNINALSLMRHLKALLAHDAALQTVFNYPTLAECYKIAAFNGVGRLHRYQ